MLTPPQSLLHTTNPAPYEHHSSLTNPHPTSFHILTTPHSHHSTPSSLHTLITAHLHHPSFSPGTCGGTLRFESSGVITSSGFPGAYSPNVNCTWLLIAPTGHYITFHYLSLAIHSSSPNCSSDVGVLLIREQNVTGTMRFLKIM